MTGDDEQRAVVLVDLVADALPHGLGDAQARVGLEARPAHGLVDLARGRAGVVERAVLAVGDDVDRHDDPAVPLRRSARGPARAAARWRRPRSRPRSPRPAAVRRGRRRDPGGGARREHRRREQAEHDDDDDGVDDVVARTARSDAPTVVAARVAAAWDSDRAKMTSICGRQNPRIRPIDEGRAALAEHERDREHDRQQPGPRVGEHRRVDEEAHRHEERRDEQRAAEELDRAPSAGRRWAPAD